MDTTRQDLQRLLSEQVSSATRRERETFDAMTGGKPLVLVGAGGLGRRILEALKALGTPPLAFADNDSRRWGTPIDGVPILSVPDAASRHGEGAAFLLSTWRSGAPSRLSALEAQLHGLGVKRVLPFAPLYWKFPERFLPYFAVDLPHKLLEDAAGVWKGFDLLADDASRREYVAQVAWRITFDLDVLPDPVSERIYFPPSLVRTSDDEVFVDAGAFDGDSARSLLELHPRFRGSILAFEPDPANFHKLSAWRESLPPETRSRVELTQAAVGERPGTVSFNASGAADAAIGTGETTVQVLSLDETLGARKITFLKVDTEGYEPNVLEGARGVIARDLPTLALSAYHRQDHLWKLPAQIHEISSRYRFHLKPHERDAFDLILYAVPAR